MIAGATRRRLLFRNELYFDAEAGEWRGDGWRLPPIFSRTGLTGSPQALVGYELRPGGPASVG